MKTITVILVCVVAAALFNRAGEALVQVITGMPDPVPQSILNSSSIVSRIVNGFEAVKNAYPYQVGLEIRISEGYSWCGGSLLSRNYILTAAHCLDKALRVTAVLGAHDRYGGGDAAYQKYSIDKAYFILHHEWDPLTLFFDIALIKFPNSITFTKEIQPIALPPRAVVDVLFEGSPAIATGWGHTSGSPRVAQYLQYADVTIETQDGCNKFLRPYIRSSTICIDGSYGKSACFGDSGGPLVVTGGTRYIIGVFSFLGYLGCEANWPSAFTRVTSYLDWISQHTGIEVL